jgi:alcohol oxidase
MFHFLEYPFSRGSTHIKSANPYETPDFDTGFMNDERDMAPMVWGYVKSRETARRMDAYAGEVENMVSRSFPRLTSHSGCEAHGPNPLLAPVL